MAIDEAPNKAMNASDVKKKDTAITTEYFYPHGYDGQPLTIMASSQEDADKQLSDLLAKNNKEVA